MTSLLSKKKKKNGCEVCRKPDCGGSLTMMRPTTEKRDQMQWCLGHLPKSKLENLS